jgi:hypothetical protein
MKPNKLSESREEHEFATKHLDQLQLIDEKLINLIFLLFLLYFMDKK